MPPPQQLRRTTAFGQWIALTGVRAIQADLATQGLRVHSTAIYHWISGRAAPRITHAAALVRMSAGQLTLDAIYRHSEELARKRAATPAPATDAPRKRPCV